MKLTDESVAKALGYAVLPQTGQRKHCGFKILHQRQTESGPVHEGHPRKLPAYTTSLDAIVAEIEARGLVYQIANYGGSCRAAVGVDGNFLETCRQGEAKPSQPALALCAALLTYLKEN
jgi:hypothetical protein